MIHKHIKSLPHHPKRVIVISLTVALLVGAYAYSQINKQPANLTENDLQNTNTAPAVNRNLTLEFLAPGRIKTVSVKAGDVVAKGQVLAELDSGNTLGALTQAKAAYALAEANYQKIINGATGPTIDVAKAAVNTAKVNLEQVTHQQDTLLANAERKLYSDNLIAEPDELYNSGNNPVISGSYDGSVEGYYRISFRTANYSEINYTGLEKGVAQFDKLSQPLGSHGLFISFPLGNGGYAPNDEWTVHIPNKNGINYTNDLNAYQSALVNKTQAIASAQAVLDQANASLTALITSARPEDLAGAQAQVSNARGALQIAEAAYQNTIITAPADGRIISVAIAPGETALPNAPAIQFISNSSSN